MSDFVRVTKKDETFMVLDADSSILYEVKEFFTFDVPGARWSPAFKRKQWDGKISLLSIPSCKMYVGLLNKLKEFCKSREYELVIDDSLKNNSAFSPQEIFNFVKSLNIHSEGKKLDVRDYQLAAIYKAIHNKRITLISPTSSGKSLIIYSIIRWILDDEKAKVLLIVPNIGLVRQMVGDFCDYSSDNGFDVISNVQTISEGATKDVSNKVVVSTWQSIYEEKSYWFNQFNAIIVDEVHLAAAKSIKGIMEKSSQVPFRIGLTGTLNESKTHELVIQGLFGKIVKVATTTDLIDKGHISDIQINCLVLEYKDKKENKLVLGGDYHAELAYICSHAKRNDLVRDLSLKSKGNTLVLFNFVAHGETIYKLIKEALPENSSRKVFLIHGDVDGDERNDMRRIVETEKDAIIVASYGTSSTGVSIKQLHNIIAASPTKSIIRVLQSIGRGLRKAEGKSKFNWIDIADDFSNGNKKKNYVYDHFVKRLEIYTDQAFNYKITKVPF